MSAGQLTLSFKESGSNSFKEFAPRSDAACPIPAEFRRYRRPMSLPLSLGCLWVVLSAIVALLPMRFQYVPGIALLLVAPVLLGWIAMTHGGWLLAIGLFALVSMFRRPLFYVCRRLRPEAPV